MERCITVAQTKPKPLRVWLSCRIQMRGSGENNFVKWKGTFRSDRPDQIWSVSVKGSHTETASKCLFKLYQINRIKHLLDRKTLLLVINSFVFSKLQYCSTVWSNTSSSNIDNLQKVQNFPGRIILGLRKYDHISDGLRSSLKCPRNFRRRLANVVLSWYIFVIIILLYLHS